MREPLGFVGTIVIPVVVFVVLGRGARPGAGRRRRSATFRRPSSCRCFAALLIAMSAVLSLVTIIAIYREGGILKRLRATPLRAARRS